MIDEGFSCRFSVTDGKKFSLKDWLTLPDDLPPEDEVEQLLKQRVKEISDLQNVLYADHKWSVLLVFQAMDAAGKDSTIKNVLSGVNPQGCEVHSFKQPSARELEHNFLWRAAKCTPARGKIGVFNRSWYEETLIVRVHPEFLEPQHLPDGLVTDNLWDERLEDISLFERHLARSGTKILKFFLNISPEEQKKRLLSRIDNPKKNWKFDKSDIDEREHWDDYMHAYEQAIQKTATDYAPWFLIPADNKPYARLAVADAVLAALKELNLSWPEVKEELKDALPDYRKKLEES